MKATLWLRIASALTLLHAVMHTIGGVFGKQAPGPQQAAVAAMKSNQFQLMGSERTFWDFYIGMGLGVSIFLLVGAIVFWQLGTLAKTEASRLRPILATFLAGYLAFALCTWRYFFVAPVITELLIALCLGLALLTSSKATQPEPNAA